MAADETVRRLAATIASNAHRAHPERRSPRRQVADLPLAVRERYEEEVDPDGALTAEVRRKRAAAAWRRDEAQRQLDEYRAAQRAGDGGQHDDDGGAAA